MSGRTSESEAVRARLDHPVIDTDGHTVELTPLYLDYLKELGGADMPRRYGDAMRARSNSRWSSMTEAERRSVRATARLGGRARPAIPWTGPRRRCRGCCTSAWTAWASTSPCSIPPRA